MRDESGAYLIDRDPKHFRLILNFLRNGSLDADVNLPYDGLIKEAEFYGLTELAALIAEARKEETDVAPPTQTTECVTMFYLRDSCRVHFVSRDNDIDESHFLIAKLMKIHPFCRRRSYTTSDDALWLIVDAHEFPLFSAKVATILCTTGFKLDRMSDDQWVFAKRA